MLSRAARKTPTYSVSHQLQFWEWEEGTVRSTQIEPRIVNSLRVDRSSGSSSVFRAPAPAPASSELGSRVDKSGEASVGSERCVAVAIIEEAVEDGDGRPLLVVYEMATNRWMEELFRRLRRLFHDGCRESRSKSLEMSRACRAKMAGWR